MITKSPKGGYDLRSKSTGKLLGHHASKADAMRQERAIKAHQAMAARHHGQSGKRG